MRAAPGVAIPALRDVLRTRPAATRGEVDRLLLDLDSASYRDRTRAVAKLEDLGGAVAADLRNALRSDPTPEAASRLTALLARLDGPLGGRELAAVRAVETLERLADVPGARQTLEELSRRPDDDSVAGEAKAALRRLERLPTVAK